MPWAGRGAFLRSACCAFVCRRRGAPCPWAPLPRAPRGASVPVARLRLVGCVWCLVVGSSPSVACFLAVSGCLSWSAGFVAVCFRCDLSWRVPVGVRGVGVSLRGGCVLWGVVLCCCVSRGRPRCRAPCVLSPGGLGGVGFLLSCCRRGWAAWWSRALLVFAVFCCGGWGLSWPLAGVGRRAVSGCCLRGPGWFRRVLLGVPCGCWGRALVLCGVWGFVLWRGRCGGGGAPRSGVGGVAGAPGGDLLGRVCCCGVRRVWAVSPVLCPRFFWGRSVRLLLLGWPGRWGLCGVWGLWFSWGCLGALRCWSVWALVCAGWVGCRFPGFFCRGGACLVVGRGVLGPGAVVAPFGVFWVRWLGFWRRVGWFAVFAGWCGLAVSGAAGWLAWWFVCGCVVGCWLVLFCRGFGVGCGFVWLGRLGFWRGIVWWGRLRSCLVGCVARGAFWC